MRTFSREAVERPHRAILAAGVLRQKAGAIERASANAHNDEIIVAVVQQDLSFGGVWTLAREELVRQLPLVEDEGGWSFTFSPKTSVAEVEGRCDEFARIAGRRWELMQRVVSRHGWSENVD